MTSTTIDYSEKLQDAKEKLGDRYLLHPSNMVKKKKIKLSPFQKLVKKTQKR